MSAQDRIKLKDRWASYAALVPLLLIFVGSLGLALAKSSALERDMRIAATQNMLWVVTQTQMEILVLTLAAGNPSATDDEIAQRFDLVLSRLNLMDDGPQARYLADIGHLDMVQQMSGALLELDPQAHGHSPELHAALFDLGQRLQPQINRIANDVMTTDWEKSAARLDEYRATQRVIILSVAFALTAALAVSWLLMRNQSRLYLTQMERMRTTNLLEQERDSAAMYRDFAAIVSHQMRTPLSLIDSAMHRLSRKGEQVTAQDVQERRAIVSDAIGRLTRLVDTVLLLAKLDNDQLQARFAPLEICALARSLITETQARHPARQMQLTCAEGPLLAQGDPHLVRHILDNLLSNALKYSPRDTAITLRVFAEGQQIACAVTDQGSGIAQHDIPHLFDRYYRGQDNMAGHGGTGLGLAVAHELAQLQGGRLAVDTWPGKGSVFTLWLPRAKPNAEPDR